MQTAGVVHDVPTSSAPLSPLGRLIDWGDHVEPFHCAAMAGPRPSPTVKPTASQKVTLVHDTPRRPVASPRLVVATLQADPFHCSTMGSGPVTCPTATQKEVVTHETPKSVVDDGAGTEGIVMADHVVPFQ